MFFAIGRGILNFYMDENSKKTEERNKLDFENATIDFMKEGRC